MYTPDHFREDRIPVLHGAIREIGLGALVTAGAPGLEATHLPMLIEPAPAPLGSLIGHMARANPQWKNTAAGGQVLAIFTGPHTYVTPSWYASKAETGKVVPTWNYIAVHAYGDVEFFDERARLRAHVSRLTDAHESARANPWAVSDAPADYIEKMLGAIIGFTVSITRLEGKWKMSQNRSPQDRAGVVVGLQREGGAARNAIAEIMSGK